MSRDAADYNGAFCGKSTEPFALLAIRTHAKMPLFILLDAERCESGRIDMLGKHASRQRDRGFESHPLRHNGSRETWALLSYYGEISPGRSSSWRIRQTEFARPRVLSMVLGERIKHHRRFRGWALCNGTL